MEVAAAEGEQRDLDRKIRQSLMEPRNYGVSANILHAPAITERNPTAVGCESKENFADLDRLALSTKC